MGDLTHYLLEDTCEFNVVMVFGEDGFQERSVVHPGEPQGLFLLPCL